MSPLRPRSAPSENRLLARLPQDVRRRLQPHLQAVPLKFKQVLYEARSRVNHAYFPIRGVVSALLFMEDGSAIEVASIGNEGAIGIWGFLEVEASTNQMIVQVAGDALRIKVDVLREEIDRKGSLHELLLRYQSAFLAQISQAVACNGLHTIQQRCCRWLLTTQDRAQSDVFALTHEFLAIMLGVRRAGVSEVLEALQAEGLIRNLRGKFSVLRRAGLEAACCECYRTMNTEFDRLLG